VVVVVVVAEEEDAEVVVGPQHIHAMLCFWIKLDQYVVFG
jgi:hypothetical protein